LFGLGFAQLLRTTADSMVVGTIVIEYYVLYAADGRIDIFNGLTLVALLLPLLAPLWGSLSASLPRHWLLVGSACYSLGVLSTFVILWTCFRMDLTGETPFQVWSLVSLLVAGAAVFNAASWAMLPAAAHDAQLPLSRAVAGMTAASALGLVGGYLFDWRGWEWLQTPGMDLLRVLQKTWPAQRPFLEGIMNLWSRQLWWSSACIVLNLGCVVGAWFASFRSDHCRCAWPLRAFAGFFADLKSVRSASESCSALVGQAAVIFVLAGYGAVLALFHLLIGIHGRYSLEWEQVLLLGLGVALGSVLTTIQGHPRRQRGLVPVAGLGLVTAGLWLTVEFDANWPCALLGVCAGLIITPLRATFLGALPAEAWGAGAALMNSANYLAGALATLVALMTLRWDFGSLHLSLVSLSMLTVPGVFLVASRGCFRDSIELLLEILIWPLYRIRAYGPGLRQFPSKGPVLVLANHTAWFDPIWLAKVLPRRLTPMMTSRFFDLPVLHWLMRHVVGAIRVQAGKLTREPPEIAEAVAALDRGECLVLFPEGYMKRREDKVLGQFGQGIWRILSQRPSTPVVVCWIEGGWGCFFSYAGGLPTKNKRLDFWRPIRVAVAEPQVLSAELLAEQRATRSHLMHCCLDARRYLGLAPLSTNTECQNE
jgi:1-acyl-sn-glycerol-3-phosphate acyltransferase